MSSDATPSARARETYVRVAADYALHAILLVNAEGRIVYVNPEGERLLGYRAEELVGQTVELIIPERFRAQHVTHRNDFLRHPTPRRLGDGRDLFARRKDGAEIPVEIGLNPVRTAEGPLVLAALIDITERKEVQAALEVKRRELESLNQIMLDREERILELKRQVQELQARLAAWPPQEPGPSDRV